VAELASAGVGAAFGFTGAGEALAVASSGEATGSSVASAGVGAAFGFAGIVVGEALAVASGVLVSVCFSGEATGSAVAVTPFSFVALGVAVDPGGQVIQHSAPAGNDRNVNPLTGTSIVSRRDFAFMIHPHFVFNFYGRPFFRACPKGGKQHRKAATPRVLPHRDCISAFWRDGGSQATNLRLSFQETAYLNGVDHPTSRSRDVSRQDQSSVVSFKPTATLRSKYQLNKLDGTPDARRTAVTIDGSIFTRRPNFSVNFFT
jgi:hypothetical protein